MHDIVLTVNVCWILHHIPGNVSWSAAICAMLENSKLRIGWMTGITGRRCGRLRSSTTPEGDVWCRGRRECNAPLWDTGALRADTGSATPAVVAHRDRLSVGARGMTCTVRGTGHLVLYHKSMWRFAYPPEVGAVDQPEGGSEFDEYRIAYISCCGRLGFHTECDAALCGTCVAS